LFLLLLVRVLLGPQGNARSDSASIRFIRLQFHFNGVSCIYRSEKFAGRGREETGMPPLGQAASRLCVVRSLAGLGTGPIWPAHRARGEAVQAWVSSGAALRVCAMENISAFASGASAISVSDLPCVLASHRLGRAREAHRAGAGRSDARGADWPAVQSCRVQWKHVEHSVAVALIGSVMCSSSRACLAVAREGRGLRGMVCMDLLESRFRYVFVSTAQFGSVCARGCAWFYLPVLSRLLH
jgi:hypothetical protein